MRKKILVAATAATALLGSGLAIAGPAEAATGLYCHASVSDWPCPRTVDTS